MGSSIEKQRKKLDVTNQQQLKFYTEINDPRLGNVKIYTCQRFQLSYILKYEQENGDTKIYNIFKKVQANLLAPMLNLYAFHIERKTCCNQIYSEKVTSYWQYYNFYFNEYLERRRYLNLTFFQTEIWHIVEMCCEAYSLFRKFGLFYEIDPHTLVITPEGKLRAFWSHLKSRNTHIKYFQYFEQKKIYRFAYSPEELQLMHQNQRGVKIDFDLCNSYRLGMLLLQCLSLIDPLSNCYNPSMTSISNSSIKNIILSKVSNHYSVEIVNLVRILLREDPKKRPTLPEVYDQYSSRFSSEFELKVCGLRIAESIQINNNQRQNELNDNQKNLYEVQDDKTVKFNRSMRRN